MSTSEALTALTSVSSQDDSLTDDSALKVSTLLSSQISSGSTTTELNSAAGILSNLMSNAESSLSVAEGIKEVTNKITENLIESGQDISISSPKVVISVQGFDHTTTSTLSPSSDMNLILPSGIVSGTNTKLAVVMSKGQMYQSLAESGISQVPRSISTDIYSNKEKQVVSGLQDKFILEYPVDQSDPVTSAKVEQIANGLLPTDDISCSYYNIQTQQISTEGCSLVEVTATSIKCACNHMTDFMAFFKTGLSVLQGSNYDVFLAVTQLNFQNLKSNVGIYLAIVYWLTFVIFFQILNRIDKRQIKDIFYERLFLQMRVQDEDEMSAADKKILLNEIVRKHKIQINHISLLQKTTGHERQKVKSKNSASQLLTAPPPSKNQSQNDRILRIKNRSMKITQTRKPVSQNPQLGNSISGMVTQPTPDPPALNNWIVIHKPKKKSKISKIKLRIEKAIKNEKKCCKACGKLFRQELATNNQIYNTFSHTSLLNKRPVRLSIFYTAIILEFALNALFYNMGPTEEDDTPFFWEGLIQNFWVAVYSALFAMVPLLMIGLIFSVPNRWIEKFKKAKTVEKIIVMYQELRRKILCKAICGYTFFILFSNFLLLYIICFCQVANSQMSKDWARSSSITIIIDLLVFEIVPALLFAFLAVLRGYCKGCQGVFCFIIVIEIYRFYRNLVEG